MENIWSSLNFNGWKGFCIKEKLKHLRKGLQDCKLQYGNLNLKISEALSSINELDLKAESVDLSEDEFLLLWDLLKQKERLDCQKSRSRWVIHGDCNSKYFHKQRKRKNSIPGIHHNGNWVDDPSAVKTIIKEHFHQTFSEDLTSRPNLNNLHF